MPANGFPERPVFNLSAAEFSAAKKVIERVKQHTDFDRVADAHNQIIDNLNNADRISLAAIFLKQFADTVACGDSENNPTAARIAIATIAELMFLVK